MGSVFKRTDRGGKRAGKYYVQYRDHADKLRTKATGTTDKDTAKRILNKLEDEASQRRHGLIDPHAEKLAEHRTSAIADQIDAYQRKMQSAGKSTDHVNRTCRMVREIAAFCEFETLGDICPDEVSRYTSHLKDEHNRAARTIQAHIRAIGGFTRWLVKTKKLPTDPLVSLEKPNPKKDRRRERRMLLPDEWPWLQAATVARGEQYGMTAEERDLLYETAIQTGLRSNELRGLTRGKLQLKSAPPYVLAKASVTKNAEMARQYVTADMAERLLAMAPRKTSRAKVFHMPDTHDVAEMLREDLDAARARWIEAADDPQVKTERTESDFLARTNHDGESLDFHSLRHSCRAWLAMQGVNPKTIQTIMRHSTITLTMDVYGHLFPGDEARSIEKLGAMLSSGTSLRVVAGG